MREAVKLEFLPLEAEWRKRVAVFLDDFARLYKSRQSSVEVFQICWHRGGYKGAGSKGQGAGSGEVAVAGKRWKSGKVDSRQSSADRDQITEDEETEQPVVGEDAEALTWFVLQILSIS